MKTPVVTQKRILSDVLISILIYTLPVLLMLLSFKISGKRPWNEKAATSVHQ